MTTTSVDCCNSYLLTPVQATRTETYLSTTELLTLNCSPNGDCHASPLLSLNVKREIPDVSYQQFLSVLSPVVQEQTK